jgi:hypothetical protein
MDYVTLWRCDSSMPMLWQLYAAVTAAGWVCYGSCLDERRQQGWVEVKGWKLQKKDADDGVSCDGVGDGVSCNGVDDGVSCDGVSCNGVDDGVNCNGVGDGMSCNGAGDGANCNR